MTSASIFVLALGAQQSFAQRFTFDNDIGGWQVYNIPLGGGHLTNSQPSNSPAHDPANGLPPGSLRVVDLAPETWIGAPASVLGNRSELYGEPISFDIYFRTEDNATYPAIALAGPEITLYIPLPPPALNSWLHWSFAISPGQWRVNTPTGAVATDAQIHGVLADLRGVFIHTEWRTGPDDTNVDNIQFGCLSITDPVLVSVCPGGTATFSITAAWTGPFTFNWRQAGIPVNLADPRISVTTSANGFTNTLTITNIGAVDAAIGVNGYDCVVSNSCGSRVSNSAKLIVATYGDMNCDCVVNGLDIGQFVLALLNPAAYIGTHPGCNILHGDINGDTILDNLDISGFVSCPMTGICP